MIISSDGKNLLRKKDTPLGSISLTQVTQAPRYSLPFWSVTESGKFRQVSELYSCSQSKKNTTVVSISTLRFKTEH